MSPRRSAFSFYRSLSRMPDSAPAEPKPSFECSGCHWTFATTEALQVHKEKCEQAKEAV